VAGNHNTLNLLLFSQLLIKGSGKLSHHITGGFQRIGRRRICDIFATYMPPEIVTFGRNQLDKGREMSRTMEAAVIESASQNLVDFLGRNFPAFTTRSDFDQRLSALSDKKASILQKVLESEVRGEATFARRNSDIDDFYGFDLSLNSLFSDILASKLPIDPLTEFRASPLFARDAAKEVEEQKELQELGYRVSAHAFSSEQIAKINSEIGNEVFINRGIFTKELTGKEIFEKINNGSIEILSRQEWRYVLDQGPKPFKPDPLLPRSRF